MTMPIERTYVVMAARKYLSDRLEACQDESEKMHIRSILRHFPSAEVILHHAKIAEAYYPALFEPMFGFADTTSPDRLTQAIAADKKLGSD